MHPTAREVDAWFLLKGSPVLLDQLRHILKETFGFGDFKFHLPNGEVIGRAHDLKSLVEMLATVPAEELAGVVPDSLEGWPVRIDSGDEIRPLN